MNYHTLGIDSALTFGFGGINQDSGKVNDDPLSCYMKVNSKMPDSIYLPNEKRFVNFEYYALDSSSTIHGGFSGAPIFWICRNRSDTSNHPMIIFEGLVFGSLSKVINEKVVESYITAIKPEVIQNDIKSQVFTKLKKYDKHKTKHL